MKEKHYTKNREGEEQNIFNKKEISFSEAFIILNKMFDIIERFPNNESTYDLEKKLKKSLEEYRGCIIDELFIEGSIKMGLRKEYYEKSTKH